MLFGEISDLDIVLALPPEELAYYILRAARASMRDHRAGMVIKASILPQSIGQVTYPQNRYNEIEMAVAEAWAWLESQLLLIPAAETNGTNGWRVLGRRALQLETEQQFRAFRQSRAFPRELLHEIISERAWIDLMRGEYDAAVLWAFKQVEVAVREAGGFTPEDICVPMMRKAFDPKNGPLTRSTDPVSEREALSALFAGAIGSYKNPHSHRNVTINEQSEAQEMVMLASHLLRIVDSRAKANNRGVQTACR